MENSQKTTEIQRRIELMATNGLGYKSIAELADITLKPKDCDAGVRFHLNDLFLRNFLPLEKESEVVEKFRELYGRYTQKKEIVIALTPYPHFPDKLVLGLDFCFNERTLKSYEYNYNYTRSDCSIGLATAIGFR